MKLNHLNLCVPDVPAARQFFETFFAFRCLQGNDNPHLSVLEDDNGFVLVLSNLDKTTQPSYPSDFHIGFMLDSIEAVNVLYDRLFEAGVKMGDAPRKLRDSHVFYFESPCSVLIEVSCRL